MGGREVHQAWQTDRRAVWRVRATFTARGLLDVEVQRKAALRLREALEATGKVRRVSVKVERDVVVVGFAVKADEPGGALYAASVIVDAAVREAGGELLGELLGQSVTSLRGTV
jgi:hypothetical protein